MTCRQTGGADKNWVIPLLKKHISPESLFVCSFPEPASLICVTCNLCCLTLDWSAFPSGESQRDGVDGVSAIKKEICLNCKIWPVLSLCLDFRGVLSSQVQIVSLMWHVWHFWLVCDETSRCDECWLCALAFKKLPTSQMGGLQLKVKVSDFERPQMLQYVDVSWSWLA